GEEGGGRGGGGGARGGYPPQDSLTPRDTAVQEPGGAAGADAGTVRAVELTTRGSSRRTRSGSTLACLSRKGVEPMAPQNSVVNEEQRRLEEDRQGRRPWKKWGPYLSERQWGTVREDYSAGGDAW